MALNGAILGKKIADIIVDPSADAKAKAKITNQWISIANEIVSHIQQMGQVQVTVNPGQAAQCGAYVGSTVSPGTGTGKIL